MTEAVVGSSEAVNGSSEVHGTLPFLSKALVGVGASISFGYLRGVTLALWRVITVSLIAGAAPGTVKSLPRVSSTVAWSNPCSPVPFAVVAGPAPLVAGAAPSGVFVLPAA